MIDSSIKIGTDNNWAIREAGLLGYHSHNNLYYSRQFNFTRNSFATTVNRNGLIEDSCYNFYSNSDTVLSNFVKFGSTVVDNVITSPNGTLIARKIVEDTSNGGHGVHDGGAFTSVLGNFQSSFYLKAGERSIVNVGHGTGLARAMNINLITGVFTMTSANFTGYVENAGNGWWRVSIYNINAFGTGAVWGTVIAMCNSSNNENYIGDGVSGIYVSGAQVARSPVPKPYLKTTNRLHVPSIDFSRSNFRTNLLQRSEEFNNEYWQSDGVSISPNVDIAPNGTLTVDLLSTSVTLQYIRNTPVTLTPNTIYTFSFYAKRGTATDLKYSIFNVGDNQTVIAPTSYFSLTNSTSYTRISVTFTTTSSLTAAYSCYTFRDIGTTGTVYVWGAQLEIGATATTYIPTVATAVTTTTDAPALLIEPQRTNFSQQSENFNNSPWTRNGSTMVDNSIISPSGANNATFFKEDSNNNFHEFEQGTGLITANTPHTLSLFVKAGTRRYIQLIMADGGSNSSSLLFDAQLGVVTDTRTISANWTFIGSNVLSLPNGWYRISLIASTISGGFVFAAAMSLFPLFSQSTINIGGTGNVITYQGDGVSGMYIWGMQVEQGSAPTSYIPTTTASVVRPFTSVVTPVAIPEHIGQGTGSIYMDFFYNGSSENNISGLMTLTNANSSTDVDNSINFRFNGVDTIGATIHSGGIQNIVDFFSFFIARNQRHKILFTYSPTLAQLYIDGIQKATISGSFNTPTNLNYVFLGNYFGLISNVSVYNTEILKRQIPEAEAIPYTVVLENNLVAYYKLDGDATAFVGGVNGTLVGTVTFPTGKIDRAINLDNNTNLNHIIIPDNDIFSFTSGGSVDVPFTISMWINITSYNTSNAYLLTKRTNNSGTDEWQMAYDTTGRLMFHKIDTISNVRFQAIITTPAVPIGIWTHVCFTDDGSETEAGMKYYINGVLVAKTSLSQGVYTGMPNGNGTVGIGNYSPSPAGNLKHRGLIDEIGIWKGRALSVVDVSALYNSGNGKTYPFN